MSEIIHATTTSVGSLNTEDQLGEHNKLSMSRRNMAMPFFAYSGGRVDVNVWVSCV